jgi:hypothetical protein
MPHTFHTQSAYGPRPYVSHMVNPQQPFMKSSIDLYRYTAPEKKGSRHNSQLDDHLIHGSVLSFSLTTANEAVEKRQAFVDNQLLGLPGPYHRHVIGTFNTCSRGPTNRSLTDTGGATTLKASAFDIPVPDLPNRWSPLFTYGSHPVSNLSKSNTCSKI